MAVVRYNVMRDWKESLLHPRPDLHIRFFCFFFFFFSVQRMAAVTV